jgi:hypothetical protein
MTITFAGDTISELQKKSGMQRYSAGFYKES